MVLPAVGFVILYNTPKFFDHQTITSNGTCVKVKTSMGDNPFYQLIYRSLLNYLLCYFAPLILIMTLSILIFKKLLSVRNQWPSNAINSKQDWLAWSLQSFTLFANQYFCPIGLPLIFSRLNIHGWEAWLVWLQGVNFFGKRCPQKVGNSSFYETCLSWLISSWLIVSIS